MTAAEQARNGEHPDEHRRRVHREHEQRPERGPCAVDPVELGRDVIVALGEPADLPRFLVECLYDPDSGNRIRQHISHA
jgi:hypothetical protein